MEERRPCVIPRFIQNYYPTKRVSFQATAQLGVLLQQVAEKQSGRRLLKNVQIQGARNPEE
jgi:hypothetical protein